jgi:hypothetical protein
MVLVAPDPVRDRPGRAAAGVWERPVRPAGVSDAPKAEAGLLARLRAPTRVQPGLDPGLAGGLRAWLEDAAFAVVTARGEDAPPLYVGAGRLLGTPGEMPPNQGASSTERVLTQLVRALFRQLVTVATIGDPLGDALDALRADGGGADVVRQVESMGRTARAALAESVGEHAAHVREAVPRFAPGCMPRTRDRVAMPLAGGRVVLGGAFDLLVGIGRRDQPSLCAVGLTVEGPSDRDRWALHYLALLEALRSGSPPFRLALLHSVNGACTVEDTSEEHLRAAAGHVAQWLHRAAAGAVVLDV